MKKANVLITVLSAFLSSFSLLAQEEALKTSTPIPEEKPCNISPKTLPNILKPSKKPVKEDAPKEESPILVVFPFELGGENDFEKIHYNTISLNANSKESLTALENYAGNLSKEMERQSGTKIQGVDKRFSNKLSSILLRSRKFRSVSRDKTTMKRILDELKMTESEYVARSQDALVGELLLANYIVVGNIYRKELTETNENIAATGETGKRIAGAMTVGYRVINVRSGICVSEGELKERIDSVEIRREFSAYERRDWTKEDYMDILYDRAADAVANEILQSVYAVKIAAEKNGMFILNRGTGSGIQMNQILEVWQGDGNPVYDPDTNEILSDGEIIVAKIQVISIQPRYSLAKPIEILAEGDIKAGARCTPIKKQKESAPAEYPVRKPNW